eukprot:m.95352 g.95352  ORF g.95352 m.95352 type:complete len:789 (-) comp15151_c0_seq3:34-2400(-)
MARLLWVISALSTILCVEGRAAIDIERGVAEIIVDGSDWLSGHQAVLRNNASWYFSNVTGADNVKPLIKIGSYTTDGYDRLGNFSETYLMYKTTDAVPVRMDAGLRSYDQIDVFFQRFPNGLAPNNTHGQLNEIVSSFPTFEVAGANLGVVWYEGSQLQNVRYLHWHKGERIPVGASFNDEASQPSGGMPLVLHDASGWAITMGPLHNFFTAAQCPSPKLKGALAFGYKGTTAYVPPGTEFATLITYGGTVSSSVLKYGEMLMQYSGNKTRSMKWTEQGDLSLRALSYYTDNGAYYYYHTVDDNAHIRSADNDTGYVKTFKELLAKFQQLPLPVQAVQYDSWWYFKEPGGGLKLWEPMPTVFPDWWKVGLPTVLHNRYFDPNCDYVKSGKYTWAMDTNVAIPLDKQLFLDIMGKAKAWGMVTYEQDWLVTQFERSTAMQQEIGLGKRWLEAMHSAAEDLNITIQYCMSLPEHILQAASFERVTQARASHDYAQSRVDQWNTPELSSLLYWAVGIIPFKDDFWSESIEPGSKWPGTIEKNPELQTLVSALLAGPVGPSDAVDKINATRIMQTCRADGVLLKPNRPAFLSDAALQFALADETAPPHLWHTTCDVSDRDVSGRDYGHHLVLSVNTSKTYRLSHQDLGVDKNTVLFAREYYSHATQVVNATSPLYLRALPPVQACPDGPGHCYPFEYWVLSPAHGFGPGLKTFALLGEPDKFVPVSPQRYGSPRSTASEWSVEVYGAPGEVVTVDVLHIESQKPVSVACVLGSSTAPPIRLSCPNTGNCTCR